MRILSAALVVLPMMSLAAHAGDPAVGENDFKKCKACHAITAEDGTAIQKGGKTGPDLYGIVGRTAGTYEGFRYGDSLAAAGEAGLVWDEESIATYIQDPKAFLADVTGDAKAKTKMTYKHRKGAEDMAAYLASVSG
ncbi:c-type cytochrome [Celeribacter neptunius]|uniref:Cytochrome c n=1 Tax=Celeribacter neptunius TaxID=588602 RepID=A0A1I3R6I6_9RHOB|nr:c-type cytochrome [Celeribacter neptunius]SFJ42213.1 cytochrome c [Celeribacter neptunius]